MKPEKTRYPRSILGSAKVLVSLLIPKHGERESTAIVEILVEELCGIPYHKLLIDPELEFEADALQKWEAAASRLLAGEPLQYVTGKAWFYDMEFSVGPGVLIPRPETEELFDWVFQDHQEKTGLKVLDVGTGSGCLAIQLWRHLKAASVTGIDISPEALAFAGINAPEGSDRMPAPLSFTRMDVLAASAGDFNDLDIIVCNPPYIPELEAAAMPENVRFHEPGSALFVPDRDPLLFYNKVSDLGKSWLRPGGRLYFEVHEDYANEVAAALKGLGYRNVEVRKDMQGKDRMVRANKQGGLNMRFSFSGK